MKAFDHRAFKAQLFDQLARIGKALANPHRLELIDLLAQGERTVEELARETAMSVANTSSHLQTLLAAQLVTARRAGPYAHYRLADDAVFRAWQAVRDLGELRLAEVDRLVSAYLEDRGQLEAVSAPSLLERMRAGSAVLLDVRPAREFAAGHITGARSIPMEELEARLDELPVESEVVAYCRGPFCVFSDEAVALLRERGRDARRLDLGYPDWRAAGLPVESAQGAK